MRKSPSQAPISIWMVARSVASARATHRYARIDERVEDMLRRGAREEVRRAQAAGISETARRALGFEELLAGDVEAMKRRTRNYAKRQLTWMRKLSGVLLIDVTGRSARSVAGEILDSCAV